VITYLDLKLLFFQDWIEIQALIGKMGKDALKRRIWERDVAKITLSDVQNAKTLLSNLKMNEVEEISKAASTFFAWVIFFNTFGLSFILLYNLQRLMSKD